MIGLDFADGLFIYLTVWLKTLALLWGRELWRQKANDWKVSSSQLFTCDKCHYAFLTKENTNITRCPRCNSMCLVRKRRGL